MLLAVFLWETLGLIGPRAVGERVNPEPTKWSNRSTEMYQIKKKKFGLIWPLLDLKVYSVQSEMVQRI